MIRLAPSAKINLGLKITGIRTGGYHELRSLFFPILELRDIMEIEESNKEGLELECKEITGSNILKKTYDLYGRETDFAPRLKIKLKKIIPIGAGLGGGSSDAATLLTYLNNISPNPLYEEELGALALRIGADVPFFLINKPALVTGIGEKIAILKGKKDPINLVLVWPEIHVSTSWAFQAYDKLYPSYSIKEKDLTKSGMTDKQSCLLGKQDLLDIQNDLELPLFKRYPILAELKKEFLARGALASGMSGSGSSMFGIFASQSKAREAARYFRETYKHTYQFSI